MSKQETSQIKSKERVSQRGEVFTAEREVNAMLDLVANECLRPDSRFLEPACGDGNFLSAILKRKLSELRRKYKKSPRDYEKLSIVAIGSLYGVDIMNDNVEACRERLFSIWDDEYTAHCKGETSDDAREAAKFIIHRNIINGNALTLMCVDTNGNDTQAPIVFSEWTLINGTQCNAPTIPWQTFCFITIQARKMVWETSLHSPKAKGRRRHLLTQIHYPL